MTVIRLEDFCVLEAISSIYLIDAKFGFYYGKTAKLYVHLNRWRPMSPTVQQILVHGATVASHFMLPIGQLSEEAA